MSKYTSSDQEPQVVESRNQDFFNSITLVKNEDKKKKSKTSKAKKA